MAMWVRARGGDGIAKRKPAVHIARHSQCPNILIPWNAVDVAYCSICGVAAVVRGVGVRDRPAVVRCAMLIKKIDV